MAVLNPLFGLPVIGWNVFLAGAVGMLLNLDRVELAGGKRSPVGHSVGFVLIWLYLVACVSYIFCIITGASLMLMGALTLAVAVGLFTHLLLDAITGQHIFTFPTNLSPKSWLNKMDDRFDRFWGAWGRAKSSKLRVRDAYVNVFSLALFLFMIAVF